MNIVKKIIYVLLLLLASGAFCLGTRYVLVYGKLKQRITQMEEYLKADFPTTLTDAGDYSFSRTLKIEGEMETYFNTTPRLVIVTEDGSLPEIESVWISEKSNLTNTKNEFNATDFKKDIDDEKIFQLDRSPIQIHSNDTLVEVRITGKDIDKIKVRCRFFMTNELRSPYIYLFYAFWLILAGVVIFCNVVRNWRSKPAEIPVKT